MIESENINGTPNFNGQTLANMLPCLPDTPPSTDRFLGLQGDTVAYPFNPGIDYTVSTTPTGITIQDGYIEINTTLLNQWYQQYRKGGQPPCETVTLYAAGATTVKPVILLVCPRLPELNAGTLQAALDAAANRGSPTEALIGEWSKNAVMPAGVTPEECTRITARLPEETPSVLRGWLLRHQTQSGLPVCIDEETKERLHLSNTCYGRELSEFIINQAYSWKAIASFGGGCTAGLLACEAATGGIAKLPIMAAEVGAVCWLPAGLSYVSRGHALRSLRENGRLSAVDWLFAPPWAFGWTNLIAKGAATTAAPFAPVAAPFAMTLAKTAAGAAGSALSRIPVPGGLGGHGAAGLGGVGLTVGGTVLYGSAVPYSLGSLGLGSATTISSVKRMAEQYIAMSQVSGGKLAGFKGLFSTRRYYASRLTSIFKDITGVSVDAGTAAQVLSKLDRPDDYGALRLLCMKGGCTREVLGKIGGATTIGEAKKTLYGALLGKLGKGEEAGNLVNKLMNTLGYEQTGGTGGGGEGGGREGAGAAGGEVDDIADQIRQEAGEVVDKEGRLKNFMNKYGEILRSSACSAVGFAAGTIAAYKASGAPLHGLQTITLHYDGTSLRIDNLHITQPPKEGNSTQAGTTPSQTNNAGQEAV